MAKKKRQHRLAQKRRRVDQKRNTQRAAEKAEDGAISKSDKKQMIRAFHEYERRYGFPPPSSLLMHDVVRKIEVGTGERNNFFKIAKRECKEWLEDPDDMLLSLAALCARAFSKAAHKGGSMFAKGAISVAYGYFLYKFGKVPAENSVSSLHMLLYAFTCGSVYHYRYSDDKLGQVSCHNAWSAISLFDTLLKQGYGLDADTVFARPMFRDLRRKDSNHPLVAGFDVEKDNLLVRMTQFTLSHHLILAVTQGKAKDGTDDYGQWLWIQHYDMLPQPIGPVISHPVLYNFVTWIAGAKIAEKELGVPHRIV